MNEIRFPYRHSAPGGALYIIGGALGLALILPGAALRWLALLCAVGPALWLICEQLRRRCAVRLTDTHIIIEQPLPLFTRRIPYSKIVGMLPDAHNAHALAYRRPPRQPGAPPRLTLARFDRVEHEDALWEVLHHHTPAMLPLDAAQVAHYLRRRRRRRRILGVALLLAVPFGVIILARVLSLPA